MKKLLVFAIAMALSATIALAQAKMSSKPLPEGSKQEEAAEKSVQITSGPTVSNVTGNSATITWATNKNAATDVRYSSDGSHWRVAYQRGGERNHPITARLEPCLLLGARFGGGLFLVARHHVEHQAQVERHEIVDMRSDRHLALEAAAGKAAIVDERGP